MRCLSCHTPINSTNTKLFLTVMLCSNCYEMAESLRKHAEQDHARLWAKTEAWLKTHVLRGGLHEGRNLPDGGEVRSLRDDEKDSGTEG